MICVRPSQVRPNAETGHVEGSGLPDDASPDPRRELPKVRNSFGTQLKADAPGERRWDISRLKADLNHEDDEVRVITVRNVGRYLPEATEAVAVLRVAL